MSTDHNPATFDPYSVLGVPRDANEPTIRRAFRKQARKAHPDGGGSVDQFNLLKSAYDILSDPDRRRRYDESGDTGEAAQDPRQAKIIEVLSIGLDLALFKLASKPQEGRNINILQLTVLEIEEKRKEWTNQRSNYQQALAVSQQLQDRFDVPEGPNLLERVVAARISTCEKHIEALDERIQLIDEAIDSLRKTKFKVPLGIAHTPSEAPEPNEDQKRFLRLFDWSDLVRFPGPN